MNQPRATLAAGMEVTPSVRLLSPLGSGGMGAVWLADHTALNTRVVVKFMLVGLDSSASARARFKREAEAASQVKSPHVVQTFDYGVTSEGVPFIVMEHLEGRDLGAEIAARGALDPAMVVLIVAQVAKALSKAHGAGLLHRDIKPDNIFLCQSDGEDDLFVKLLDFGIAKTHAPEGEAELDSQTKTGQVVGTPFYMSPEQVTAQKVIDLRSDLWSLGIVAFEALTGKRAYDGPSFGALAVKIATGEPPRPSEANPSLPPSVDAWFARACAREPSARFASARELAEKLRAAFDGVVSLPPVTSGMSDSGPRTGADATASTEPAAGAASIPSVPPGPISVDDDARPRNSFVLASTVDPTSPSADDPSLARSEGGASVAIKDGAAGERPSRRDGPSARMKIILPVAALLVITLAIAAGWKAKEHTSEDDATSAEGASGTAPATAPVTGVGASGPDVHPSSAITAGNGATAASASASASAAAAASASASASGSASAAPSNEHAVAVAASAGVADAGARALASTPVHAASPHSTGARPAVGTSTSTGKGKGTGLAAGGPSAQALVVSSSKPVDTAPKASAKPTATSHGDPLY